MARVPPLPRNPALYPLFAVGFEIALDLGRADEGDTTLVEPRNQLTDGL